MANRHLARSVVLQTLFECDASQVSDAATATAALARNIAEFGGEDVDRPFTERLLTGVIAKQSDIDTVIQKAAPDWPFERIAPIDRAVLRLGLYELLFADRAEVPAKVAINEAIELAKTFSGESSGRFVNGVLGAVYKELGVESDTSQNARRTKREDYPLEKMGGAIVYARHDGQYYLALVHDVFGHWTLPKGHMNESAEPAVGVANIVKDELGLDVTVEDKVGENEYIASHPEKGKVRKHVWFHLARASFEPVMLKKSGGLDDARWFRLQDIIELNFYDDMLPIVTAAVQKLLDHASTHGAR